MKHESECFEKFPDCICLKCENDGLDELTRDICCNQSLRRCSDDSDCPGFQAED